MRNLFTLLMFFLVFYSQIVFSQSERSFVKSFVAEATNITVDLDGIKEIKEWNESFIRIHVTVGISNFNEDILKRLIALGRYSIESITREGEMILIMPKLMKKVTIKGVFLNEYLSYEVLVPKGTIVNLSSREIITKNVN
jgi:hypothetical protein